jgi:transposase
MNQNLPQELDPESLNQLPKEKLVEIIIEQSMPIVTRGARSPTETIC